MRVLVYAAFVAVLTILGGCHGKQEYEIIYLTEDVVRTALVGKVVDIPALEAPSRIYYQDSVLFFKDNLSLDAQMYVYDFRKKHTNLFIRRGRGPGELLGAFYFAFINDGTGSKTLVYDITQGKILEANTDSLSFKEYHPVQTYADGLLDLACITGYGKTLIGLSFNDGCRIVEVPRNDTVKVLAGYNPDVRRKNRSDFISQAYEGVIKSNVNRHSCVVACRYSDQIEIFDMTSGDPVFVKGPLNFEPACSVVNIGGGKSLAHDDDERKGYLDVCCSDDFIYALYSGRKFSEGNSSYGRTVRVLDWNGKFEYEYILDRDILSIDYSPDEHSLYGISSLMEIVKYEL